MGVSNRPKDDYGGVLRLLLVLIVLAAVAMGLVMGYRHWHHKEVVVPAPVSNTTPSDSSQDFNTPPVPGTETVHAEPLFDPSDVRHLNSDPSAATGSINPTAMKNAYSISSAPGGSGTIAIVDAYDDPYIEQDLNTFSSFYSLRSCTGANGCFEKHKMGSNLTIDSGWSLETVLDTQWAHAIAPNSRILLVEAKSSLISDLMNAVDYARSRPDVVSISLSWGANEFNGETGYDSRLTNIRGIQIFAAAGDSGHGVWWPSAAPTVIGVGGTTLTLSGGVFQSETAWSNGGGGQSIYESEPSFQSTYGIPNASGKRGIPDVSYNADSNPGVPIYTSVPYGGQTGWFTIGGTSAGTPQWAAIQAISRKVSLAKLYQDATGPTYSSFLRDITSGNNGGCGTYCNAGVGYDYVTGLGSPLTTRF